MQKHPWTVASLFFIFIGPLLAAFFFYQHHDYQPAIKAYGELLQPPLTLKQFSFGQQLRLGKWQLISFNEDPRLKHRLTQIRLALGKHKNNIMILFLSPTTAETPFDKQTLLLVDPQGFIILRYSIEALLNGELTASKGILKDMQKLFRLAHG